VRGLEIAVGDASRVEGHERVDEGAGRRAERRRLEPARAGGEERGEGGAAEPLLGEERLAVLGGPLREQLRDDVRSGRAQRRGLPRELLAGAGEPGPGDLDGRLAAVRPAAGCEDEAEAALRERPEDLEPRDRGGHGPDSTAGRLVAWGGSRTAHPDGWRRSPEPWIRGRKAASTQSRFSARPLAEGAAPVARDRLRSTEEPP